ncbi:hypothetical protein Bca4012_067568 [Brassica carinata]
MNSQDELGDSRTPSETPNGGSAYSSAGIPAPSCPFSSKSWAEEEGKRAKEQARALEEARKRWETNGIRVIVDKDLQEDVEQSLLVKTVESSSVSSTEERARTLMDKLKEMGESVGGKSREVSLGKLAGEMRDAAIVSVKGAAKEGEKGTAQVGDKVKRMAEECRDGVGEISQRLKKEEENNGMVISNTPTATCYSCLGTVHS